MNNTTYHYCISNLTLQRDIYFDLLSSYMNSMNEHRYEEPLKYLSGSQQRLLDKVLSKYEELSEQHLIEFGVLLGDQNVVLEVTNSVRRS